jgi:1,4-dihydroxy-2-naphthoate octaprenyltransferase
VKVFFENSAGGLLRRSKRTGSVLTSLRAFLRLTRPQFLAGGIAGGALGTAVAAYESGAVDWGAYALSQFTISAFHLMTQYANEYFDRAGDALAVRTQFSGGSGVLVDRTLGADVALRAALVCALAGAGGAVFLWKVAPAAAGLAIAIAILAWTYSAPPVRLLARGLGELDTVLVVAILVPACAYAAQTNAIDARMLAATLPGAGAMLAMMLGVEFPDLAADTASGKRNLLVRFGAAGGVRLGSAAVLAIYVGGVLAVWAGAPPFAGLALLGTLPLSFGYLRILRGRGRDEAVDLERLAGTGVALFFIATTYGALAFFAAAAVRDSAAARTEGGRALETNSARSMVEASVTAPSLFERANAALDAVRPTIQRDGGDVWLVRIDGRTAFVQMLGACGGCPMSNTTLRDGIEASIVAACPEILTVEQV